MAYTSDGLKQVELMDKIYILVHAYSMCVTRKNPKQKEYNNKMNIER